MILYVRNLPSRATAQDVRDVFERIGPVDSVTMLSNKLTGRPLGVAVIELPEDHEYQTLNHALIGVQIDGRDIAVGPQRERHDRRSGHERRDRTRHSRDRRAVERRVIQLSDYR